MIEKQGEISLRRQCVLLNINRSRLYNHSQKSTKDAEILSKIKEIHAEIPIYGYRKIKYELKRRGTNVNLKKIQRIMRDNNIFALKAKKNRKSSQTQVLNKANFLMKNVEIQRVNQVWATDISYIKMPRGFVYLASVIDVYSRKILGYHISTVMDSLLCITALRNALKNNPKPEVINSDQGTQYTSDLWIQAVKSQEIQLSMDGKGRWADNVYIERFWRTVKQENVFLQKYQLVSDAKRCLSKFIEFYNFRRLHQNLAYQTPDEVYNNVEKGTCFVYAQLSKRSR